MIYIKKLNVNASFRYLWLKHVIGVDLTQHCARCFKGTYVENISPRQSQHPQIDLKDGVYYLCGVSLPYIWEKNFHLAFHYKEGSHIEYENNGISVVIENAERLPISEKFIDQTDPNAKSKQFCTCRNWQFAHYLKNQLR